MNESLASVCDRGYIPSIHEHLEANYKRVMLEARPVRETAGPQYRFGL